MRIEDAVSLVRRVFRGSDAAASLKLDSPIFKASIVAIQVFRGSDAAASLKRRQLFG